MKTITIWRTYSVHFYQFFTKILSNILHKSLLDTLSLLSLWSLYYRCLVTTFEGKSHPSSGLPNCSQLQLPFSHSNSSQQVNASRYITNCNTEIFLLIKSRHGRHRKYCSSLALYWPLRSNDRCIVAYFVVTWQGVYMPLYCTIFSQIMRYPRN
jgi:hypothetical protein